MSDYRPIPCAQHCEYELMAMHRTAVELQIFKSEEKFTGKVVDITTRNGAEYMIILLEDGQRDEVRLDQIESVIPIDESANDK